MRLLFCLILTFAPLSAQTKLLRFPDIHGDQIVFTYAGDLWKVSDSGGTAVRLTAHPGLELFARFSPDSSQIAFTGQYDGDEQVYVIPATGGEPRQLTWYPSNGPLPDRWGFDHIPDVGSARGDPQERRDRAAHDGLFGDVADRVVLHPRPWAGPRDRQRCPPAAERL